MPPTPGECLALEGDDPLVEALRDVRVSADGVAAPITRVEFLGLTGLQVDQVWEVVGGRPPGDALDGEQAAMLLVRLSQSGLFAEISPTLDLHQEGDRTTVTLRIALREHPRVKNVVVQGIDELLTADLIDVVLETPPDDEVDRRRDHGDGGGAGVELPGGGPRLRCPAPSPPAAWLARDDDEAVGEGILWRGLEPAMDRLARYLIGKGYHLASFGAVLTPDGTLAIVIDEGRIRGVSVEGVPEAIRGRVMTLLGLTPGAVFLEADLEAGMDRVHREFPFLRSRRDRRLTRGAPRIVVERDESGGARGHLIETRCPTSRGASRRTWRWHADGQIQVDGEPVPSSDRWSDRVRKVVEVASSSEPELHLLAAGDGWEYEAMCTRRSYQLLDGEVVVHFRVDRGDLDVDGVELLRHTPVTGYAPGLEIETVLWDRADRAHLTLRSEFNVNTGRASRDPDESDGVIPRVGGSDLLAQLSAQERIDWGLGGSARIPRMALAELGFELHSRTDTADRWRLERLDSYLYSMVVNRPEAEYFRRTGASAFATFTPSRGLLFGAEYRYDRYDSLSSLAEPRTWFRRDEPGFANPEIDAGRMGSVLLRAEWASGGLAPRRRVPAGQLRRYPETSLFGGRVMEPRHSGLHTMITVEISRPGLGSDDDLSFSRLITENRLHLATGSDQGLSLRIRGELGRGVPAQKRAALGGWGSVRGYGFKELDGSATVLLGAEYHFGFLSAFVDLGTTRHGADWSAAAPGVGTSLHFGDFSELALAWRTDEAAELTPEVRLLFGRPF